MRGALRERVRDEIRAELAKHNPIETARVPLELIAETSIHVVEDGGSARYRVVDQDGQPRTKIDRGQPVDLTIQDLVAEIRAHHPTLFQPANDVGARPEGPDRPRDGGQNAEAGTATVAPPDNGSEPAQPKPRDWLMLGLDAPIPAPDRRDDGPHPKAGPGGALGGWAARLRSAPERLIVGLRERRDGRAADPAPSPPAQPAAAAPAAGRRRLFGVLAGVAAALLAGVWIYTAGPRSSESGSAAQSAATAARAPAEPTRASTEPMTTGTVPPTGPSASSGAAGSAATLGAIRGVPEVVDTSTLRIDGKIVRLFGVEWARGAQAEDLARYLRGREIVCRPVPSADTARCQVDGRDLSEVVLFNGGGRATASATPDLVAAENRARTERIGIWRK